MRVLVCGGRNYSDKCYLWSVLDGLGPPEVSAIISGAAKGADALAAEWAKRFGFPLYEFPADWKAHGKAAGPIRNQRMIDDGKPDLVVAFAGGRGTADMTRRAEISGIPIRRIPPPNPHLRRLRS